MSGADPLPWLLEPENPSARYLALTGLLDRPASDAEVTAARAEIANWGPVRAILDAQWPEGYWMRPGVGYSPKYRATVWQVICSRCGVGFPIQVPHPPPWRMSQVRCTNCSGELVIDFAEQGPASSNERGDVADSGSATFCEYCQKPIEVGFSRVLTQGVAYLQCGRCGRVPRLGAAEQSRVLPESERDGARGEEGGGNVR